MYYWTPPTGGVYREGRAFVLYPITDNPPQMDIVVCEVTGTAELLSFYTSANLP